jgi:hypothetical protein
LCVRGASVVGCGLLVASMTEAEAMVSIGGYGTDFLWLICELKCWVVCLFLSILCSDFRPPDLLFLWSDVFYTADRAMIFGNGLVVVVEPLTKIAGLFTSGVSF